MISGRVLSTIYEKDTPFKNFQYKSMIAQRGFLKCPIQLAYVSHPASISSVDYGKL